MSEKEILRVEQLSKSFPIKEGFFNRTKNWLKAVNNISFSVNKGETLALVGESGCGKSTTRKLLLNSMTPDSGKVVYDSQNIFDLNKEKMRNLRRRLQVVFQDPYASLDPKWKIGNIINEPLKVHSVGNAEERRKHVEKLMSQVGLDPSLYNRYAHEFSGGQKQRIGIARALALEPELIIADEPVSALDVSVQAQVLNMFNRLKKEFDLTYIFISHDLSVVRHISDRVAVMYLGEIVESSDTETLFNNPKHPYTKSLIESIPDPNSENPNDIKIMKGEVPSPINPPSGCPFHPRCEFAMDICKEEKPSSYYPEDNSEVKCHLFNNHIHSRGEKSNV